MEYFYVIPGNPVSWCSHKGTGRRSYNPHFREKRAAQWHLLEQHKHKLALRAVPFQNVHAIDFHFHMPIPKSQLKKITKRIEQEGIVFHKKRPDRTNLLKFAEDCLTGIVITDDNIVATGRVHKFYSQTPKTVIRILVEEK